MPFPATTSKYVKQSGAKLTAHMAHELPRSNFGKTGYLADGIYKKKKKKKKMDQV